MSNRLHIVVCFLLCLLAVACSQPTETITENKESVDDISVLKALPLVIPTPANNPITPEKIELGKLLFFDPILSGNRDVACATCHHPDFAFAEGLELSIGVNGKGFGSKRAFMLPNDMPFVKRNSQSVVNTAFNGLTLTNETGPEEAPMFWDLRAKSLESQSLEPTKALEEMRGHGFGQEDVLAEVIGRLRKNAIYTRLFKTAFAENDAVNALNLSRALATYERSLVSNNSRFDQYMRGETDALSELELRGLQAFLTSGCAKCHNGPMLTDFKVHAMGVIDNEKLSFIDDGVQKAYTFRTPTLRNLRYTLPYMHNGKITTIRRVLEFYEDLAGGKIKNSNVNATQIDPLIKHLRVDFKDISLIERFLDTLNDDSFDKIIPKSVPSGLKVGGDI